MTITVSTNEYRELMSMMYSSKHLIDYVKTDVLKYNELAELDLKYLHIRMDRVTKLINKIEQRDEKTY